LRIISPRSRPGAGQQSEHDRHDQQRGDRRHPLGHDQDHEGDHHRQTKDGGLQQQVDHETISRPASGEPLQVS
jgi:hypothetical protein